MMACIFYLGYTFFDFSRSEIIKTGVLGHGADVISGVFYRRGLDRSENISVAWEKG